MSQPPYGHDQAGEQANPDLDRILAELAGFTATNNASAQPPVAVAPAHVPAPAASLPFPTHHHVPQQQLPARQIFPPAPSTPQPQIPAKSTTPPSYQPSPTPPVQAQIDPSTILEWPQALRCVNKISASNPQFGPKLKEVGICLPV